jgi:hypothetical protein
MKYAFLIVVLILSQTAFSLVPSRRSFLEDLAITSGVAAGTFVSPQKVLAAAPISKGETENVGAQTIRFFRPKPPKILRPKLASDFAVLLMRSSYQVTGTCTHCHLSVREALCHCSSSSHFHVCENHFLRNLTLL